MADHLLSAHRRVSPFFMERRQTPSLYKEGSLSSTEERAPVFSIEWRDTPPFLCSGESVSRFSIERTQKRVFLFSMAKRETLTLCTGESVSLLNGKERDACSLQRRECLSLLYREEAEE